MVREIPQTNALQSRLDRAIGRRDGIRTELSEVKKEIKRLEGEESLLDLVTALIRQLIDQEVNLGVRAVERLQTEGLQTVFDDQDLRIRADVKERRGKISVDLVTIQQSGDKTIEGTGNDMFGGAVATVESILLRIIIIFRRNLRPVLFLDETLPAFDHNYISNMGQFCSVLCERLGMDILAVTHNPALIEAADHGYRILKHNGTARFEKIR